MQNNTFHLEGKKKNLIRLEDLVEKALLLVAPFFLPLGHSVESTPKLFIWLIFVLDRQLAICALCLDNSQSK